MLAKITSKNQITIPKKIIDKIPNVKHFDVELKDGDHYNETHKILRYKPGSDQSKDKENRTKREQCC